MILDSRGLPEWKGGFPGRRVDRFESANGAMRCKPRSRHAICFWGRDCASRYGQNPPRPSHIPRQNIPSPYSQRDCRGGKGDSGGAGWSVLNQQTESWGANPAPVTPSAFGGGLRFAVWLEMPPRQMSRRPLARSCFAGRSRRSGLPSAAHSSPHRPVLQPRPSLCKPARRALPCPYRVSRARPAMGSSPCVRKLSPVLPPKASGWHPLRCGGGVGPTLHLR